MYAFIHCPLTYFPLSCPFNTVMLLLGDRNCTQLVKLHYGTIVQMLLYIIIYNKTWAFGVWI